MADLERAVAGMFAVGFPGIAVTPQMRQLISRGAAGAVLFKRNYQSAQQVARLCADLKEAAMPRPLLICADQEGGRVIRFGPPFTAVPSMRVLGARGDRELARAFGRLLAVELRAAGVDMDLAPVLDVDTNPANPVIADRSFGRTPGLVTEMGLALIEGMQSAGVAACGKHFPGHGDTAQDSHHDLPRLPHAMDRLEAVELPPFAAAARAGLAAIMTAHVIFGAIDAKYPATMSRAVLHGVLRERLGFDGVIVSDDLGMKAVAAHYSPEEVIVRGAGAGVDLFLMADDAVAANRAIDLLLRAVERGDIDREVIQAANRRLERLCTAYVRPPASATPRLDVIGCEAHRRIIAPFAAESPAAHDPTAYSGNQ
jgi:beta-N-acetylhexosaminidase